MTSKDTNTAKKVGSRTGFWVLLVAALVLEGTACLQYVMSRRAIKREAVARAQSELRKAELEIEKHTIEMEAAAKTLAMMAEKHVDSPDSIFAATRSVVGALENTSSIAVAYVPDYFPKEGRFFEVCSSRISEDSIYTRQIGSVEHDYTQMEWWQNGFVHDSCWWCEPYLDDSGSQTWVVSCSYPVRNRKGEVVAVVCIDLSLNYLQQVSEYLQIYEKSFYSISSNTGVEIVPVPDTIPGRKYYIFHEEIEATGWHLEIVIPDEVLFAELRRTSIIISILMLLGLVVLALILMYARHTTKKLVRSMEKNQRMENELNIARTIQMAMLPKVFPPFMDRLDLNIYGMVDPAKEVGGDLYDFYVRHDKLFFCIGDVSGKGVPAALVMAMTRSFFRSITAHEEQPEVIVGKMNKILCEQNPQNMFLTLFLGVLDCKTGELTYCNAGHNAPLLLRGERQRGLMDEGVCELSVVANLPLGVVPEFEFVAQKTKMYYNDLLFLYTDGLTEAENKQHNQYGEERMIDTMESLAVEGVTCPREVINRMQLSAESFVSGAEQSDDLTMLAIRYQTTAIVMRNDIQQIPTLTEWIDGLGIPTELNMPINLALEEAVSNVMLYAYPGKSGQVFVEFVKTEGVKELGAEGRRLVFTITDSGIPFDPTQTPEADVTLTAEEREIGGLGIYLVRQLMDEVRYERTEDKNILTLVKNI